MSLMEDPMNFRALMILVLLYSSFLSSSNAEPPRLVEKDGTQALFVDGHPFLILGGQIHNSSAWPSELGCAEIA
jgi:hypothetical protein